MGPARRLVTIKRSGLDGPSFPLSLSSCLFGRGIECDIRIQLPVVSKQHCKIEINRQEAILSNFSSTNPTQVNGSAIDKPVQLKHGDVITIVDRSFRYENESHQHGSQSTEFPGQRREQEPSRRVSRSSFSSNPGGKVQDSSDRSKLTEENVSGKPLVHEENTVAAGTAVSDGSEEGVARETPDGVHSSGLPRDNCRSATDPTAGAFQEDSSVTLGSCNGGGKAFPTIQGLKNSDKNESPFRRLYESMKLELDVKSEKVNVLQNRRKSGSRSHCTTEKESAGGLEGESPISLVSLKSRLKSSRSPQIKGEQGSSQTGEQRSVEETVQAPKDTRSPGILRTEMVVTKTTTPLRYSQQNSSRRCQSEDLGAVSRRESVSLDQSEGFGAEHKMFTPQKFLPRNQTPIKVENAGSFGNTPEKFSKKRKSIPTSVDNLPTETEMVQQTVPAPLVLQAEGKIQNGFLNKTAGQTCPGAPGPDAADAGSFGDSINKVEGVSLKRRRVSFGGRLRPELFDENLPPNTPLKRGETPKQRRSLVAHTPAVLKKIIKEQPHPSGKGNSSETRPEGTTPDTCAKAPAPATTSTPPAAADRCRRSPKASSVSSGSRSHQADTPKRGGRKSGNLPSKRASLDRSQHGILQMIYSKRRSGASEANLIVAKSWADVVKLGAKQTQTKAVKRGPQRLLSKRQRRANTPKKPTGITDHQFSTGHANSPCTIIIGKAHIERVNGPARPHTMRNTTADFSEDLSGLTEMFQTPVKEKPQRMSLGPSTLSNSGDFIGKKLPVSNSGEEPLLHTAEYSGENVFPSAQEVPAEPSGKRSASPGRLKINERTVKTPGSVYQAPGAKRETQESEAAPPKAAPSANRCRRCAEPRARQRPGAESASEDAEPDTVEDISGRRLRNAPPPGQKSEGRGKESERFFERCKKNIESKEDSGKMMAVRRSRRASELKWEPTADLTTLMRLQETEFKEDSVDIPSVPQTPARAEEPTDAENRTTKLHWKSPQPDRISSPARTNTQPKTPSRKGDVEEVSALGKPTQTPGDATHTDRGPGDDENINLCKETPKQKQNPAENVTGSKRRPRTPKEKARSLEDLIGFKELFQTPHLVKEPMIDDKTPQIPCKSPRPEPVVMSTSMTRPFKTLSLKAEVQEDLSALRKPTQTPGDTTHSHGGPAGADKDIQMFNETSRQKLDPVENVTGIKRRPRTPKEKVQSLEDLAGFKELFQTPVCTKEPTAVVKTPQMLWISPQPEPNVTPTNRKRQLKTPPQKVDREVELSAPRKSTQTPGETRHSDSELVGDDEHRAFKESPKQKLDSAENVAGSKKRSRTPKTKAPPLEDLIGFKELFQTPHHVKEPVTDDKNPKVLCQSPQPEPLVTSTSMTRLLKTPPRNVEMQEDVSALRKPTQTAGNTRPSHRGPVGDDKSIRLLKETPEQKLESAENLTGSKRRPRTPKEKVPPLEDLIGFKELFQTPHHTVEPMTDNKPSKIPCKSPPLESVNTPSRKRQLKTAPQKVDREGELSALRKPTQTPGDTTHSHGGPAGADKDIQMFNETSRQKLDFAESVTGIKRRPRTPKEKVQSLEDLAGFKELFQTPVCTKEPTAGVKNPQMLWISPQPEPNVTPTNRKRQLKTPPQKVDREVELSAPRKSTQTPGETRHSDSELVGDDEHRAFKESPKQKLDSAENVAGSKKRSRTPKTKAPPLEDMTGFKELFQTPHHVKQPMTDDKTPQIPCKSPRPEPVDTPASRKGRLKTAPRKAEVQEGLSALTRPTQTSGDTTLSHRGPEGGDRGIAVSQETPKPKLDSAANVAVSKRRPRTPKEKAPPLEDLTGFKELFQTPDHAKEPVAENKITRIPCKSPPAEPVTRRTSRKRRLRSPPGKVGVGEVSALGEPTLTPGDATHREAVGDDKDVKVFRKTSRQKLDSAEKIIGVGSRLRSCKQKTQPLEDPSLKELVQKPRQAKGTTRAAKATTVPCQSAPAEPAPGPTGRKRRLKSPPEKADVAEVSALREPIQAPGETTRTHGEPVSEEKDTQVFRKPSRQKLDPSENITGMKSRLRTFKEKTQPLEAPDSLEELVRKPDQTREQTSDAKIPVMPCQSPPAQPVTRPTSRKRWLRSPPGKAGVGEVSALGEPTLTPGDATHREAVGDDKDVKVFRKTSRQKLDSAEKIIGVGSWLRSCKEKTQPLEDPSLKELVRKPRQAKELGSGAAGIKRAPKEAPVGRNPAKIPQRVLRAPKLRFMEDLDLVGKEDPMKSPSASSVSPPPPKRRRGEDGSVTGRKTLRPATATQGIAGERSPQKPRTAPRDGWPQPEPLVRRKKSLRTLAPRTERVENLPDGDTGAKATGRQAEDAHPPAKGMSLRSRGRSKTDVGEQQPESLTSAEKVKMKRNEKKPLKTSQEKQLQRPEDGADNPASGGQVHERRMCLRSRRQQKTPPPAAAEESAGEEGAEPTGGSREWEGAAERAGLLGLRSRRTAAHPPATPAESESERRVTRGARRHARGPPKAGK
uniref:LOW QUALITY PROTEIN: proliferation marker protein Ki-67 n=1 Tax=Camelus bactrianus TaxID=9837 RepID=A0A9W3GRF2_CAMBA|nr:LOW QUALITY PROTEIN: proliferation marker protein Ki-67 [Camelus bactrianus]